MASRFLAARSVSAPAMRLVSARPWLSGTTALALATLALFGWFLIERWDDVDVTVSAALQEPLVNGSAHLAADADLGSFEIDDFASSATFVDDGFEALAVSHEWTSAAAAGRAREPQAPGGEPGFERIVARPAAAPAVRGAWLTGAIEDIADDDPARHAHRLEHRGELFRAAPQDW